MKTKFVSTIILMLAIIGIVSIDVNATFTVATFADPSRISTNPLFEVDFIGTTLNGGWSDAETGLRLDIPYIGNIFTDAWFEMTEVEIIDSFGNTGGDEINFYANGVSTNPLLIINFENGYISRFNFGADEIFVAENVSITGSEITAHFQKESSHSVLPIWHICKAARTGMTGLPLRLRLPRQLFRNPRQSTCSLWVFFVSPSD